MSDFEAIIELAKGLEPARETRPKFSLWSDHMGKWHAKVTMHEVYVLVENRDSAEDAIRDLRDDLIGINQKFSKRMAMAIRRWSVTKTVLSLVKGDSPSGGA